MVTGLANKFDARQKLNDKSGLGGVKAKLGVPQQVKNVPDARQKILQSSKFTDARARIESKKSAALAVDARSKILNAQAKKTDARQLIKRKQQTGKQSPGSAEGTKVVVTGLGRILTGGGKSGVLSGPGGSIVKTIKQTQGEANSASSSASAIATNIVRTINNTSPVRPQSARLMITTKQRVQPVSQPKMIRTSRPVPEVTRPHTTPVRRVPGMSSIISFDDDYYEDAPPRTMRRPSPIRTPQERRPVVAASVSPVQKIPVVLHSTRQHVVQKQKVLYEEDLMEEEEVEEETYVPTADVVSPIQGFRVLITNLHPMVTEEDIVELFGAIGAFKRARLMKPGTAEVVYLMREHAVAAVKKYHLRELDHLPMHLVLAPGQKSAPKLAPKPAAPKPAAPKPAAQKLFRREPAPAVRAPSPVNLAEVQKAPTPAPSSGPLKFVSDGSKGIDIFGKKDDPSATVETALVHRALFKTQAKDEPRSKPVSFTVKI